MDKEQYICENYKNRTKSTTQMQKELKMSPNDIYEILKKNNIELHGNKLSKEKSLMVCDLYKNGFSIKQIKEKTLISEKCIATQLKLNKIQTRREGGRFQRKYQLDETIFEKIDSHEKAQFLGLIYADGTLSSFNKLISVRLREDDVEYLNQFKNNLLKTDKPIGFCKSPEMTNPITKKKYAIKYRTAMLEISSAKIYNDLLKYGLCPKKTWANLPIPNISNEFLSSFLLGYFEGDGCITYCPKSQSATFACQAAMSQCIYKALESNGIFSTVHKRKYITVVQIARKEHIKKLYSLLYGKSQIFMLRKKQKFEKIVSLLD